MSFIEDPEKTSAYKGTCLSGFSFELFPDDEKKEPEIYRIPIGFYTSASLC